MKIGIDCRLWNESGVGRYTRNLVEELALLDKKNTYVLFFRQDTFDSFKTPGKNFRKKLADIRWHSVLEQTKFISILNKEKLDLVHFPYFSMPVLYKGKYVLTIHDLIIHHFGTGEASTLPLPIYKTKKLAYLFAIKQAAKNARKIIVPSEETKNEVVNHLSVSKSKISVVYEGVDQALLVRKATRLKNPYKEPYFLYVGNAYPHKNLKSLCGAFLLFSKKNPTYRLICIGMEDFFYKRLKQEIKDKNKKNRIVFLHSVSDKELVSYYRFAKSLIMPSFMEGFGLPILEAMANNCPVLASDIPVFREIASSNAVYFNPYEVSDIEKKMQSVVSEKSASITMRKKKAFERCKKFSWKEMAKETLSLYLQAVN